MAISAGYFPRTPIDRITKLRRMTDKRFIEVEDSVEEVREQLFALAKAAGNDDSSLNVFSDAINRGLIRLDTRVSQYGARIFNIEERARKDAKRIEELTRLLDVKTRILDARVTKLVHHVTLPQVDIGVIMAARSVVAGWKDSHVGYEEYNERVRVLHEELKGR